MHAILIKLVIVFDKVKKCFYDNWYRTFIWLWIPWFIYFTGSQKHFSSEAGCRRYHVRLQGALPAFGILSSIWPLGRKHNQNMGTQMDRKGQKKTLLLSYHGGGKSIGALVQFTREILEHILVSKLVWVTSPLAAKFLAYLSCIIWHAATWILALTQICPLLDESVLRLVKRSIAEIRWRIN